jgi:hypothetical protein
VCVKFGLMSIIALQSKLLMVDAIQLNPIPLYACVSFFLFFLKKKLINFIFWSDSMHAFYKIYSVIYI